MSLVTIAKLNIFTNIPCHSLLEVCNLIYHISRLDAVSVHGNMNIMHCVYTFVMKICIVLIAVALKDNNKGPFYIMLLLNMVSLTKCDHLNLSNWKLAESQYQLPKSDRGQIVAFDERNNSIVIVGGNQGYDSFVTYNLNSLQMIYHDEGLISMGFDMSIYCSVQSYVQHGNMLYYTSDHVNSDHFLYSMEVSSKSMNLVSSQELHTYPCFASISLKHDYLFIIGGKDDNNNVMDDMSIYDITNQSWKLLQSGPYLNTERWQHICTSVDQRIYVVSGWNNSNNYLSTIEVLDVSSGISDLSTHLWQTLTSSLPAGVKNARSINYHSTIIILGGQVGSDQYNKVIYAVNTMTNEVYTAGTLPQLALLAPAILVWPVIHVFGGSRGWGFPALARYQYLILKLSDIATSRHN